MAGKPQDRPMIQNERSATADGTEPEWSEDMTLRQVGNSTTVTIPTTACKRHELSVGECITVEIHAEGIFIPTEGGDE